MRKKTKVETATLADLEAASKQDKSASNKNKPFTPEWNPYEKSAGKN
jgi:hypothetical protein